MTKRGKEKRQKVIYIQFREDRKRKILSTEGKRSKKLRRKERNSKRERKRERENTKKLYPYRTLYSVPKSNNSNRYFKRTDGR